MMRLARGSTVSFAAHVPVDVFSNLIANDQVVTFLRDFPQLHSSSAAEPDSLYRLSLFKRLIHI